MQSLGLTDGLVVEGQFSHTTDCNVSLQLEFSVYASVSSLPADMYRYIQRSDEQICYESAGRCWGGGGAEKQVVLLMQGRHGIGRTD